MYQCCNSAFLFNYYYLDNHSIHTLENTNKYVSIYKGLHSESYPNSGSPRTLLNKCAELRLAALASGAIGCFPGRSFKCLNKFGEKDPKYSITNVVDGL